MDATRNIRNHYFEKYLHRMVLNLNVYVKNVKPLVLTCLFVCLFVLFFYLYFVFFFGFVLFFFFVFVLFCFVFLPPSDPNTGQ